MLPSFRLRLDIYVFFSIKYVRVHVPLLVQSSSARHIAARGAEFRQLPGLRYGAVRLQCWDMPRCLFG